MEVVYDYNVNTMLFDGIQLYKEEFGSSYTYDDDGNVISVVDLQKKNTTYEYDANGNLTKMLQDNQAKMTYTYDTMYRLASAQADVGSQTLSASYTYTDGLDHSHSMVPMIC